MNSTEIDQRISEIENSLKSLNGQIEKLKKIKEELKMEQERLDGKPSMGEFYYSIDETGCISENVWGCNHWNDNDRFNIGNAFKTFEDAEFELERRKVYAQLRRLSDTSMEKVGSRKSPDIEKYTIIANLGYTGGIKGKIYTYFNNTDIDTDIFFSTDADAESAIKTIGEDRLLKYYFRF